MPYTRAGATMPLVEIARPGLLVGFFHQDAMDTGN